LEVRKWKEKASKEIEKLGMAEFERRVLAKKAGTQKRRSARSA
jgi:hypothetical protein